MWRDFPLDDAAGGDDCAAPDLRPGKDRDATSKPNVVFDHDRLRGIYRSRTYGSVHRTDGVLRNPHVRNDAMLPQHYVVPDGDSAARCHHAAEVDPDAVAQLEAPVLPAQQLDRQKRGVHDQILSDRYETTIVQEQLA
jgi:hypothetical protein